MNTFNKEPIEVGLHPKGVNTVTKETSLPDDTLRASVNFDISNEGKKKVRPGYTEVYSGSNIHSLSPQGISAGTFFVENGALKRLEGDMTATTITSVSPDKRRRMQYTQVDDKVYYTNGLDSGMIKVNLAYSWGVPAPEAAPKVIAVPGSMNPGVYHIKYTYLRDGEESGATDFTKVTVPSGGAIQLTSLPSNMDADWLRVYSTQADGDRYYKQIELPVGSTSYTMTQAVNGKDLETDHMENSPTGHLIEHYNGRIYWANGKRVYWTESIRYGLFRHDSYILFPERISVLIAVRDGLYVVSDKTYYLDGRDPSKFQQKIVYPNGGIEGTHHKLYANVFNIDDYFGDVACWMSTKGLVYGQNNGTIKAATEKKLALDSYNSGAATFFEKDGIRKLLIALQNTKGSNNFRASDKVTATVTRANEVI